MKFRVTMKDPDCLHDTIREAVGLELDALKLPADLSHKATQHETNCPAFTVAEEVR